MTLLVVADTQDYLLLAGDHCAVVSGVSNPGPPDLVLGNYRKVYPWKYGALAASGDVFLLAYFHRLFMLCERRGQAIDLLRVARLAKQMCSRSGIPPDQSTGNLYMTLPGQDGFRLHAVFVAEDTISTEVVEPISAQFSMQKQTSDVPAYHAFIAQLRPSFLFQEVDKFHLHHLELLRHLFAKQSAGDDRVTSTFDVFMLEKRTGQGLFWPSSVQTMHVDLDFDPAGDPASPGHALQIPAGHPGRLEQS